MMTLNAKLFVGVIFSIALLGSQDVIAQEKSGNKEKRNFAAGLMQRSGGFIMDKTTGEGAIAIVNAQNVVKELDVLSIAEAIEADFWLRTVPTNVTIATELKDALSILHNVKGNVFIVLAQIDIKSSIFVMPEERCVVINVKQLHDTSNTEKTLARIRKEAFRAVGYALQVKYPAASGGLMDPAVTSVAELDKVLIDRPEVAFQADVDQAGERFGLIKYKRTTYRKACERGVAPKPVNKYQQAIWDEFHELPSSPIKILPESKRK